MNAREQPERRTIVARFSPLLAAFTTVCFAFGCASQRKPGADMPPDMLVSLRSAEARDLSGPLTVERLTAIAIRRNPDLIMLREDVRMAEAAVADAREFDEPELRIGYGNADDAFQAFTTMPLTNSPLVLPVPDPNDPKDFIIPPVLGSATSVERRSRSGNDFRAVLRVRPPNPFAMRERTASAKACLSAARAELQAREWQIACDVREGYDRILFCREDLVMLDRLIGVYSNETALLDMRAREGGGTLLDTLNASRNHVRAVLDRSETARDLASEIRLLADLAGLTVVELRIPAGAEVTLPVLDPGSLDAGFLESLALGHRADLTAAAFRCMAAKAAWREQEILSRPWVSFLEATFGQNSAREDYDPTVRWTATDGTDTGLPSVQQRLELSDGTFWRIEAGIVLPFFSWARGVRKVPEAEMERANAELSTAWRAAVFDVRNSLAALRGAAAAIEAYERESGPGLERIRALQEQLGKIGPMIPADEARARETIINSERALLLLNHEYRVRVHKLTRAIGCPLPAWLSTATPAATPPEREERSDSSPAATVAEEEPLPARSATEFPEVEGAVPPAIGGIPAAVEENAGVLPDRDEALPLQPEAIDAPDTGTEDVPAAVEENAGVLPDRDEALPLQPEAIDTPDTGTEDVPAAVEENAGVLPDRDEALPLQPEAIDASDTGTEDVPAAVEENAETGRPAEAEAARGNASTPEWDDPLTPDE